MARPENEELTDLLRQFVCVRLTSMKGVDLSRFQFDYDLSWAAFLMNAEERIYARYGGRDAAGPAARLSRAGFQKVLREVLAVHRKGKEGREGNGRGGKGREEERRERRGTEGDRRGQKGTVEDLPPLAKRLEGEPTDCVRCHWVWDCLYEQERARGTFKSESLWVYPLPENLGITLDADRGNVVKAVAEGSAAAQSGLRVGEVIEGADDVPVFSEADLRWALHRAPGTGRLVLQVHQGVTHAAAERAATEENVAQTVSLPGGKGQSNRLRYISRGEQRRSVTVELRPGWRQTDRSWREFQGRVRFNPGFLVEKLDRAGREALGLDADMLALKVTAYYWNTPGDRAGLGVGDVIVAVNGTTVSLTPGQFYSLLRATEADMATLTVQRGNQRVSLRLELQ